MVGYGLLIFGSYCLVCSCSRNAICLIYVAGQAWHLFGQKYHENSILAISIISVILFQCFYGWVWLKVISWWYLGTFCLETYLGDIPSIIIGNTAYPTRHFRQFSMKKVPRGSIFDTFRALSRRREGMPSWYFGVILPNLNHELPWTKVARIAICPWDRMSYMPKKGP